MIGQFHAPTIFTLYRLLYNTDWTSETTRYKDESHMMMIMVIMIIVILELIRYRRRHGGLFQCTRLLSRCLVWDSDKLVQESWFTSWYSNLVNLELSAQSLAASQRCSVFSLPEEKTFSILHLFVRHSVQTCNKVSSKKTWIEQISNCSGIANARGPLNGITWPAVTFANCVKGKGKAVP